MATLEISPIGSAASAGKMAAADMSKGLDLDAMATPGLNAFQTNNELGGLGRQMLEYGVSNPFLNGEISFTGPPEGGLISGASRESSNMVGGAGTADGMFEDPGMNNLVEGMKEMYLEGAKTMLAWSIVHQISKDTKVMLQAQ